VKIVLSERNGRQRALHTGGRDGKPELSLDGGRRESRRCLASYGIEDEIAVEIGRAYYHAVAAIHTAEAAQRREPARNRDCRLRPKDYYKN